MSRWIAPMLLAAALAVGWPLLLPWSYETRDGTGAAFEAAQLDAAMRDGQLPVRWLADLDGGRGLPVFVYASPLAFYAIALVHASGLGVLVATKVVVLLALVLAGFATYAWLKTHVAAPAAGVGAAAYAATPILAALVHMLGDPAVVLAYALVPLVFLGARAAARTWSGVASLGFASAALILTDASIAVALLPLVAVYAAFLRIPWRILAGIALGALASVFQWGPAWWEQDLVRLSPPWSPFGTWAVVKLAVVPVAILVAGFARGRGRALVVPAFGAACVLLALGLRPVAPLVLVAVVAAAIVAAAAASGAARLRSLLLALSVVPPIATAAFAVAREEALLGLLAAGQGVAAAIAIAAATLDDRIVERGPPAIAGLLVALVLPWSSAAPVRFTLSGEPAVSTLREHDLTREQVRHTGARTRPGAAALPASIAPGTAPPAAGSVSRPDFDVRGGELQVTALARTAKQLAFDVDSESGGILALAVNDFPGWELTLAGAPDWRPQEVAHGSDRAGCIAVSIPPGRWRLEASWTETPLRRACDEASAAGAGMLVVLFALSGLTKPHAA